MKNKSDKLLDKNFKSDYNSHMKCLYGSLFLLFLLLTSCGNEPPVIGLPRYAVLVYQKGSFKIPSTSIFLSIYFTLFDENGDEDLHQVRITHLEQEYSWIILPHQLSKAVWGDTTYRGFSFLDYKNKKKVLLGSYSIEVEDKAGNITQTAFEVTIPGYEGETFEMPEIPYTISAEENKESVQIEIKGGAYSSCEIKLLNNPDLFKNSRKKYTSEESILLPLEEVKKGTNLSVRINTKEEKLIFFLADKTL